MFRISFLEKSSMVIDRVLLGLVRSSRDPVQQIPNFFSGPGWTTGGFETILEKTLKF